MKRLLLLTLVSVLVLSACGQQRRGAKIDDAKSNSNSSSQGSGGNVPDPAVTQGSKWDRLLDEVKRKHPSIQQDQDRALDLLAEARKIKRESDKLSGDAAKAMRKKAAMKYAEAGTIYDVMREAIDDVDENLWDRKFHRFQSRWDRAAKGLKRLSF